MILFALTLNAIAVYMSNEESKKSNVKLRTSWIQKNMKTD